MSEYRNHFEILKSRPVRPSFEDIATLVSGTNSKSAIGFPLFSKLFLALLLATAASMGAFFLYTRSETDNAAPHSNLSSRGSIEHVHPLSAAPENMSRSHTSINPMKSLSSHSVESMGMKLDAATGTLPGAIPDTSFSEQLISECPVRPLRSPLHAGYTQHDPKPIQNSDPNDLEKFFIALSGSISNQFSSNAALRQTSFSDANVGVGYQLSPSSSFKVIGGEEVFMIPGGTTIKSIYFKDTVIVNDSVQYHNVLGEFQTTIAPGSVRTYWLGAGYRYTITSSNLEPYAELLAGAATQGIIAGASVGISVLQSYPVTLDAGVLFHALFPVGSSMLTKFGASIELQYAF